MRLLERFDRACRLAHLAASTREQYGRWVAGVATGDWGESTITDRPARELIMQRMPTSLLIGGTALLLSLLIATFAYHLREPGGP